MELDIIGNLAWTMDKLEYSKRQAEYTDHDP